MGSPACGFSSVLTTPLARTHVAGRDCPEHPKLAEESPKQQRAVASLLLQLARDAMRVSKLRAEAKGVQANAKLGATGGSLNCGRGPLWRLIAAILLFSLPRSSEVVLRMGALGGSNEQHYHGVVWRETGIAHGKPYDGLESGGPSIPSGWVHELLYVLSSRWRVGEDTSSYTHSAWDSATSSVIGSSSWDDGDAGWYIGGIVVTSACRPSPPQSPSSPSPPPLQPSPVQSVQGRPGGGTLRVAHDAAAVLDELVLASGLYTGTGDVVSVFESELRLPNDSYGPMANGAVLDADSKNFYVIDVRGPGTCLRSRTVVRGGVNLTGSTAVMARRPQTLGHGS